MRTDRTVIVTGAAGGIGALLVDRFVANGDRVVATDLHVADDAADEPGRRWVSGDISSEEDCARIAGTATDWTGRIDILVNCAGHFPLRPFEEMTAAEWRRVVDINLTGTFLMTRAAVPAMKGHGWGRIINFGSGTFFKGSPNHCHYIAAKAGVIGLTRCLATELGRYGITANVVTPGLTVTEPVRRQFPPALLEFMRKQRPLARDQQPDDLVGVVHFLASPDADFMTGQVLNVDGGAHKH